jgi:DNA polymerase IV
LPARTRRILHLDVDAFLASVEQAVHPELAGKPVVIGGMPNERNLVMSCSYPARAFGVKPGILLAEAARLCPQAIFRRGDSQAAKRLREAIARILMRATPIVEVSSIDDFFADLTGATRALGDAFTTAVRLRGEIARELSLPVTIGIGTNRTLARLAGKLAKPGGVAEILPGHEVAFLRELPIEHLPGAGHALGRMLERFGITRAGELALVPREVLFASFGALGLTIYDRARGIDPEPVEATFALESDGTWTERMPRSIRRDSTFEPEEGRREIVEAMFAYLVERAAHKLRSHGAAARALAVRVQYVDTRPKPADGPRETNAQAEKRAKFERPSDSTDEILRRTLALWRALPRRRALVKRIGITLVDLVHANGWQMSLFDEADGSTAGGDTRAGRGDMRAERGDMRAQRGDSRAVQRTENTELDAEHDAEGEAARGDSATVRAGAAEAATPGGQRESRGDRQRRLDRALDSLRERHGFGHILRGSSFALKATHELSADGFRLRTPSLNQ